ncbi:MAG TPA: hypothetical protein VFB42_03255 [Gaiellaceae bacterium]|nr:hypothetical protein [Gaiellaceae bacterium]
MTGGGLPPVDAARLPAEVRAAGPHAVALYQAALSFEGVLDEQLARSLVATLRPPDGGDAGSAGSLLSELLPQAVAQSLVAAGGLGLAPELYRTLSGPAAGQTAERPR